MKTLSNGILFVFLALLFIASCGKLDNYDGPNASIKGAVKDAEGGALIEQDIDGGSKIIIKELGFKTPVEQQLIFKVNGEYQDKLLFANKYDVYFNESNFVKPDTLKSYEIKKGENTLDFSVKPYIRVSDVSIVKSETDIVATFTITPTVANKVREIGLFGHIDRIAGTRYALQRKTQNIGAASQGVPVKYTLRLSAGGFKTGQAYYFRVGGLIDAQNAKYNYASAVRLTI